MTGLTRGQLGAFEKCLVRNERTCRDEAGSLDGSQDWSVYQGGKADAYRDVLALLKAIIGNGGAK